MRDVEEEREADIGEKREDDEDAEEKKLRVREKKMTSKVVVVENQDSE